MASIDRKTIWHNSLQAMKKSLLGTYEFRTIVSEQERFLKSWCPEAPDYTVFSDYRRNEGRRRIHDILEVIDDALARLEHCDNREAAMIFHNTMKQVALFTKVASILEMSNESQAKMPIEPTYIIHQC
ncbi:MAG: hypothetical protein ACTSYL_01985 [Candidatus Thorarchaeota archaeon]